MNNVIIVGNGKSVLNCKNGHVIDSFDAVVRLNRFKIKGYEDFVGNKTDIVAVNEQCFKWLLQTKEEYDNEYKERYRKFLLEHNNLLSKFKNEDVLNGFEQNYYFEPIKNDYKNILILFSNHEIIPETIKHKCLFPKNLNKYSTGYLTIEYFLEKNFNVTITGFDSYQNSSCYWSNNNNFFTEDFLIKKRTGNFTDGHPYRLEKLYINRLLLKKKIRKLE